MTVLPLASLGIITCSDLKRAYRDITVGNRKGVMLIYLRGDEPLIADRISKRNHRYMPPSLSTSQFETLEEPTKDEHPVVVSVRGEVVETVTEIAAAKSCCRPTQSMRLSPWRRARTFDELSINTIRMLAVDAVQKANSGHPGTPMDAAPTAYALWQRVLRYDPTDPLWLNRDRFVLSAGHASMLLYSMIHLTGIKAVNPSYEQVGRDAVTLDDIKSFRQAGSRCPGHPEYGWTSGVEIRPSARPGRGHQRRHGDRPALAGGHVQPAWLRPVRLQRLCAVGRRLHDGRYLQ